MLWGLLREGAMLGGGAGAECGLRVVFLLCVWALMHTPVAERGVVGARSSGRLAVWNSFALECPPSSLFV